MRIYTTHLMLLLLLLAAGCTRAIPSAPAPAEQAVPAEFQALYAELDQQLDDFAGRLQSQPKAGPRPLVFATELLVANSNRGQELLKEQAWRGSLLYLDRLQELGVRGVKVNIAYPLLSPEFPRSSEYLAFYKKLAQELKSRKMAILVGAGITFNEPAFSNVSFDYRKLTRERYLQAKRQHIETIIREIQPDYVTIANEPDTEGDITGFHMTLSEWTEMVNGLLKDLDHQGVLVGAGAGTWSDPAYIENLARIPTLNYIDIHIYPVNRDFMARAMRFADIARANNKRVIVGEAWLYKSSDKEVGSVTYARIIARDVFGFWQPLDEKFLGLLAQFARQNQVEFISPFWSRYLFGYLDYTQTKRGLAPAALLSLADAEALKHILANTYSKTGLAYQKLARPGD